MEDADVKRDLACPPNETLRQLIDGTLDDVERIELHLQECEQCQQQLDHLSQSDVLSPFLPNGKYHIKSNQIHFLTPPSRSGDLGTINELFVEAEIGRGGAGIVFRGFDPVLSRPVAIKVLSNDGSFRSDARFQRESKIAAKIRNDHVVNVHAVGRTHNGRPYFVMPLIAGRSLKEALSAELTEDRRTAATVAQVASGLQAIHAAGIVHRDVKPANILIDDEDGRAKLTDFGLARETMADDTLTQADVLCGTPEYMSPEQSSGKEAGPQSDVYSLGITMYECLTGTTPFRGKPLNILRQHCLATPAPPSHINPKISRDLETICLKSIAKEPRKRYPTSQEMADDLNRFLAGKPILARTTPIWEKGYLWSRRNPVVATLSAITTALLITLAVGASLAAWNLAQANTRIMTEKQNATEARKRAVQDRAAAVNALNDLVDSLYDDLSDNSVTIKAREKLVAAAMNGLQSVTRIDADETGDKTEYLALMRMADLAGLQGDDENEKEIFQRVIELSRQKVAQNPEDDEWVFNLAKSISAFGIAARDNEIELSENLNSECLEILTGILEHDPENFQAQTALFTEKCARLEIIRNRNFTNPDKVIKYGSQVLAEFEPLLNSAANQSVSEAAYSIHFLLGRAYLESGKNRRATQYFQDAKAHIESALEEKPNNFYLKSASGTLDRALSMSSGAMGNMELSLKMYQSSVAKFQQLSAANPDNIRMKIQLAGTYSLGSQTLLFNGREAESLDATSEADRLYRGLTEISPENDSFKILLSENWLRKVYLLLVLGYHDKAHRLSIETDEHLKKLKNPAIGPSVMHQLMEVKKYKQVTSWLVGQPPESPTLHSKINAVLFSLRPVVLKRNSFDLSGTPILSLIFSIDPDFTGTSIKDVFDWVKMMGAEQPFYLTQIASIELGVYGIIGKNCTPETDTSRHSRRAQCLDHCIDLLKNNPLQPLGVMGQPDLVWLRETDEFKALLPDLQTAWFPDN